VAELRRLPRLWRAHARLNVVLLLHSRQQTIVYLLADLVGSGAGVVAVLLLAKTFGGIAGWTVDQLLFLSGYGLIVSGLSTLFFSYNVAAISRRIGRGQLDHSLIQPQSLVTSLVTEGFAPVDAAALLLPGVGLVIAASFTGGGPVGAAAWAALPVLLVASTALLQAVNVIWGSVAFWAPQGAEELSPAMSRMLESLKQFPLDPLLPVLKGALATIVPVAHLAWLPSSALLGRHPLGSAGWTLVASAVSVGLAAVVFGKGMSRYGRDGSQRYSDFGHRR
jgi:ABC-2 type transport system permease protein